MSTLIIYHQSKPGTLCPDGAMAAAIAHLYCVSEGISHHFMGDCYRNEADYPPLPDFEVPGDVGELIIVDFSYPRSWLDYWESNGLSVRVLDHHEPKFKLIGDFSGAVLDANECGATIAWKYFFPDEPQPELLLHVKRRDIGADGYYEGLCPDSDAINEGLGKVRHEVWSLMGDQVFTSLSETLLKPELIPIMQRSGELAIENRDRIVAEACDRSVLRTLGAYEVPFLELLEPEARYHSLIGNALCKVFPTHPFSWVITPDGGNHLRSARNLSNFDVSAVAREFGGNGHHNAAGFQPQRDSTAQ
jgi:uncharacterized protein